MTNVWLRKIYSFEGRNIPTDAIGTISRKLTTFIYDTYTKLRVNQLFNIIIGNDG